MINSKVPRGRVAWFPTVNNEVCTGDQECFTFCKNDVFEWDEAGGWPVVANPYKCVLGCNACMQICPVEAIMFPSQQEFQQMIRLATEQSKLPALCISTPSDLPQTAPRLEIQKPI